MHNQLIYNIHTHTQIYFQNTQPVGICKDLELFHEPKQTYKNKHVIRAKTKSNKFHKILDIQEDSKNQKNGHWSREENIKYLLFLKNHLLQFQQKNLRRTQRIFKQMSDYLGSRTASQCRSHHQKLEKKYQSFQNILNYLNDICSRYPAVQHQQSKITQKNINEKKKDLQILSPHQKDHKLHWHHIEIDDDFSVISYYEMPKILHPQYFVRQKLEREDTSGGE